MRGIKNQGMVQGAESTCSGMFGPGARGVGKRRPDRPSRSLGAGVKAGGRATAQGRTWSVAVSEPRMVAGGSHAGGEHRIAHRCCPPETNIGRVSTVL